MPYEYGVFDVPDQFNFDSGKNQPDNLIRGGDFDPVKRDLHLVIQESDDGYPAVLVYKVR